MESPIPQYKLQSSEEYFKKDTTIMITRIETLKAAFFKKFGKNATIIARSPGRVNLIGEHLDYSDYSVLPMAVSKDCLMAIYIKTDGDTTVDIANINPKYLEGSFKHEVGVHVTIDSSIHEWTNYFKCGYKGIMDVMNPAVVKGFKVMVDGNVPAGSGLSSSSAFVCCAALATMYVHDVKLNKGELTAAAIKGESYAGVAIGGINCFNKEWINLFLSWVLLIQLYLSIFIQS
jgi:galactokinase